MGGPLPWGLTGQSEELEMLAKSCRNDKKLGVNILFGNSNAAQGPPTINSINSPSCQINSISFMLLAGYF
jgi:hypothetical protein